VPQIFILYFKFCTGALEYLLLLITHVCKNAAAIVQEFAPSDEEFAALRAGEEWDPEKARLKAEKVLVNERKGYTVIRFNCITQMHHGKASGQIIPHPDCSTWTRRWYFQRSSVSRGGNENGLGSSGS